MRIITEKFREERLGYTGFRLIMAVTKGWCVGNKG